MIPTLQFTRNDGFICYKGLFLRVDETIDVLPQILLASAFDVLWCGEGSTLLPDSRFRELPRRRAITKLTEVTAPHLADDYRERDRKDYARTNTILIGSPGLSEQVKSVDSLAQTLTEFLVNANSILRVLIGTLVIPRSMSALGCRSIVGPMTSYRNLV